jgi:hypothetical protein
VAQRRKSVGAAPRAGGRARAGRRMAHQVSVGLPWYVRELAEKFERDAIHDEEEARILSAEQDAATPDSLPG